MDSSRRSDTARAWLGDPTPAPAPAAVHPDAPRWRALAADTFPRPEVHLLQEVLRLAVKASSGEDQQACACFYAAVFAEGAMDGAGRQDAEIVRGEALAEMLRSPVHVLVQLGIAVGALSSWPEDWSVPKQVLRALCRLRGMIADMTEQQPQCQDCERRAAAAGVRRQGTSTLLCWLCFSKVLLAFEHSDTPDDGADSAWSLEFDGFPLPEGPVPERCEGCASRTPAIVIPIAESSDHHVCWLRASARTMLLHMRCMDATLVGQLACVDNVTRR